MPKPKNNPPAKRVRDKHTQRPFELKEKIDIPSGRQDLPIAWNFKDVEWDHPKFHCTYRDFLERSKQIVDNFEGKTFREIERDQHSHRWPNAEKLSKEFQEILKEKHLEQAELYQLHITGKCRLYGHVTDNIFHVIAFDQEHEIYKVPKKHT